MGLVFGSFRENPRTEREARQRLHESKMQLLSSVANSVGRDRTRKQLPKKDIQVQYFHECSAKEKLAFRTKLEDYMCKMEMHTARIEAETARIALKDFDRGDYASSRIKPYFLEFGGHDVD